jgi:ribosomal protein L32
VLSQATREWGGHVIYINKNVIGIKLFCEILVFYCGVLMWFKVILTVDKVARYSVMRVWCSNRKRDQRRSLTNQVHSFIHLVVCLTTGPKPLPKRALHTVRSRASSFRCEYTLLSLRSPSSFLRLLPSLPVTSILSITCLRRQFLRKMWPIQNVR